MSKLAKLKAAGGATAAESMGARKAPKGTKTGDDAGGGLGPKLAEVDPRFAGVESAGVLRAIPTHRIEPDPHQPRKHFDPAELRELADSLVANGQAQAAAVYWAEEAGKYRLIYGERRWRACQIGNIKTLDCRVYDERPEPLALRAIQLTENLARANLGPIEEARAFERVLEETGKTARELAAMVGWDPGRMSRSLSLLKLAPSVVTLVESGELSPGAAYEIGKIKDPGRQGALAATAIDANWTRDDIRARVKELTEAGKKPKPGKAVETPAAAAEPEPVVIDSPVNSFGVFTRYEIKTLSGDGWGIAFKVGRDDAGRYFAAGGWWVQSKTSRPAELTTRGEPHPTAREALVAAATRLEIDLAVVQHDDMKAALADWKRHVRDEWHIVPNEYVYSWPTMPGQGRAAEVAPRNSPEAEVGISVKGRRTFDPVALAEDRFGDEVIIGPDSVGGHGVMVHAEDFNADLTRDEVTDALRHALARWLYWYGPVGRIETGSTVSARTQGVKGVVIDRNVVVRVDELVTIRVEPVDGKDSFERTIHVDELDPPPAPAPAPAPVVETAPDGGDVEEKAAETEAA